MDFGRFGSLNRSLFLLREAGESQSLVEISDARVKYAALGDEELRATCRAALAGQFDNKAPRMTTFRALRRLFGRTSDPQVVPLIALAAEAFRRAPADLGKGKALYPEQIRAALGMTSRTLVEMDTGEGKTYAILPAAFALCCTLKRVYIICASDYLAWRDASRTAAFWDFAGVRVGLALESTEAFEWGARVVYTTLEQLMFKALRDDAGATKPQYPLTYTALLLDEADAILLDDDDRAYQWLLYTQASTYDWSSAFAFCDTVTEPDDITVNRPARTASLTEQGERKLRELAAGVTPGEFLRLRFAIETAYVGLRVVHQDIDYIEKDGRLLSVDLLTGRVQPNITESWLIPIESQRGFATRPVGVVRNRRTASSLFADFEQISGTSGTIVDDALEFLFSYSLWSMRVEPKFPRRLTQVGALIYGTAREKHTAIAKRVAESHNARRPVLVGCQTPADAEAIWLRIRQELPDARVELLTGRNEEDTATVFDNAGQPDSILVSTQVAGRGVDIRLTDEARANGGLDLICAGHSLQRRHDRQFLGRAGRHGDPYSAGFYCSLDDQLLVRRGGQIIQGFLQQLGMEEGTPLESGIVNRSLRRAQREETYYRFTQRRGNQLLALAERDVYLAMAEWFARLQASSPQDVNGVDDEWIENVVNRFVDHQPILQEHGDTLTDLGAGSVAKSVSDLLVPGREPLVTVEDLEGHTPANARQRIRDILLKELRQRVAAHRRYHELLAEAEEVGFEIWMLRFRLVELDQPHQEDDLRGDPQPADPQPAVLQLVDPQPVELQPVDPQPVDPQPVEPRLPLDTLRKIWEDSPRFAAPEHHPNAEGPLAVLAAVEILAGHRQRLETATPETVQQMIDALKAEVDRAVVADTEWETRRTRLQRRTLRQIAYWSLQHAWIDYLDEHGRIQDRLWHSDLKPYEYYRAVTDRTDELWAQTEASLPERILRNLMLCDHPDALDALFVLEEHLQAASGQTPLETFDWTPAAAAASGPAPTRSDLIERFVTAHESEVRHPFNVSMLRLLLREFLDRHPIESLASPRQILTALDTWAVREMEIGVESRRRKLKRRWLGKFLQFLRDERLIGSLPTLRHRLANARRRLVRRFGSVHVMLPISVTAALAALIGLLAWVGNVGPAHTLTPFLSWLDAWIAGGGIGRGNILAPTAAGLILSGVLTWMLWPLRQQRVTVTLLDYVLCTLLAGTVAFVMFVPWPGAGVTVFLTGVTKFAGSLLLLLMLRRLIVLVMAEAALDLLAGWLLFTTAFVVVPRIATGAERWQTIAAFAVLAVGTWWWSRLSRVELEVFSVRGDRSPGATPAEQFTTSIEVRGDVDFPPFLLGLIAAWGVVEFVRVAVPGLSPPPVVAAVAAAVYFIVTVLWLANVLRNRFAFPIWKQRLNARHQIMSGFETDDAIRNRLEQLRQRLLTRQTLWQAAIVAAAVILLREPVPGTLLPAGLFVVSAASVTAFEGQRFFLQLRNVSMGQGIGTTSPFDIEALREPEEDLKFWERVRRVMKHRLAIVIGIILVVLQIANRLLGLINGN